MNKVKEKLKKYFSENDIDKLLEKLESKQRSFLINNNYFVKIGKNSNKFFFDNLIKEKTATDDPGQDTSQNQVMISDNPGIVNEEKGQ